MKKLVYLLIGIFFGIIMFKSEAASWFRIYEMFQFKAFHMYGIIGVAIVFGILFVQIIKYYKIKDINGEEIIFTDKNKSVPRYLIGGIFFGLGWALVGSCPGPMFTLLGAGFMPIIIVLIGAVLGTWFYGLLRKRLPH